MGRKKLTKILVESGTDTDIRNKQSETACDIAIRKNLSEIVTILRSNVIERPLQSIILDLDPDANDSMKSKQYWNLECMPRERARYDPNKEKPLKT
eukprot:TRINITY_DN34393_c0_g1_i1.p1 TRINITY_DN34393_c0_g1~~TRINITY_DN34393_c0_g1_i1.p1  ORF type:complete len:103 (-),score=9.04 TRINITY_DN34393_c0_g1_i1:216-503(-)